MDDNNSSKEIMKRIISFSNLKDCDKSLCSNMFYQIAVCIVLAVLYFCFRRRAPWVYYPNIKNKPQHPCYQEHPGFFSWVLPLITINDTQLLSMIGLDGFMFLQTIKLLYRICFILSFLIVPFLCSWFYKLKSNNVEKNLFLILSLHNVKSKSVYWAILVISYILTVFIFYLIFIYYKRYVTLRQLYLASPATMTSISDLKKISKELGSDIDAINYINVSSRTIVIDRLPASINNDKELLDYLIVLNLGEIESVSLIHSTYDLQKMYEERNGIIQDIEKEITKALHAARSHFSRKGRESFGQYHLGDLERSSLADSNLNAFSLEQKVKLFNNFYKKGEKFFTKTSSNQTYVHLHINRLKEVGNRIVEERKKIDNEIKQENIEIPKADEELFVDSDLRKDVSFFSFQQITNFSENKDYFTLDLPVNKKKAFITFKNQKTAGIIQQTKLGSRVFSSNIRVAPTPNDVMWKTIGKNEVSGFFFQIISLGLYALFILAFLVIIVSIIKTLDIKEDTKNLIFSLLKGNAEIISLYQSILVPLVYNILLYFVPITIKALIHMEDVYSYSDVQVRLMYKLSLFLFFNAFIAPFITSCIVDFDDSKAFFNFKSVTEEVVSSVIKASVFFFNTIVQRLCVGSAIVFLKPVPFLYNFLIARFVIYTRRQQKEREFTPPIDFGNHIPNLLLIVPMALVYSCIAPLMLVVSWLFFFVSYYLYKNELVYASRNDYESGGSYWKPTTRFIFYSVLTFQIVTAIYTFSVGFSDIFILFFPLIFFTFIFSEGLNIIFDRSCEKFPLNAPEEKFLDKFAKKTLEERYKLLKEWKEIEVGVNEDELSIEELGCEDQNSHSSESFYKDPALLTSFGCIILPLNFYRMINFLQCRDQKNLFGLSESGTWG